MLKAVFAISLLLPAAVRAEEPEPADLFIGMVMTDGEELVLERCNLGRTRYRLKPAAGTQDPLGELRGRTGKVQAQLAARYRADGEQHILEVIAIVGVRMGKTCHLLDAVDESFATDTAAPEPDEDRWGALAAGAAAPSGTATIGSGEHPYRFTLLHPRTGKPSPHTDFALSASRATDYELPFVADAKKVFQGRTDEQGRTPVFRLPVRLPDAAFDLRERFGSGPYGETFHLTDHNDNDLFNTPYLLITCTSPPRYFRGYTYPNGDTAYAASDGPINIQLRADHAMNEPLPKSCEDERSQDGDHVELPATNAKYGKPDASLVGHYYLSGVMETGSELQLKADGRFDWYISYGAVDQVAKGRWGRTGQTVTLVADLPSNDAPLFRVDQSSPWDETAERRLRDAERAREAEAIAERCPWSKGAAASPPLLLPDDRPPAGPAERARAEEAKRIAEAARDEASRATAKAAAAGASEAERTAAEAAMSAWYNAHYEMEQAYRVAEVPMPDIGSPVVPRECHTTLKEFDATSPPVQWRRGVAVVVGDPARAIRLSRVGVTFVFSDGRRAETQTSWDGWAFAPLHKDAAVVQLALTLPEPFARSVSLPIPPLAEGVQAVSVDTYQLIAPPFKVMRLQVQGGDLIPEDMGQGRYSRN